VLIEQVRGAVAGGYREVVLLGQTVNSYHDGAYDFADLLRAADQVEGLERIRFTSPHPADMSERVIAAMAECAKVMPQVHLPLQSASDRVLAAMDRGYTLADYRAIAGRLRAAIPGLAMSTDIIVGFPGETETDFQRTAEFMREWRYDSAFLFKYSARPDTRAFKTAETVDEDEKGRRLSALIELQHAISGEINDAAIGRAVEVLVEGPARRGEGAEPGARGAGQLFGKSREFKSVVFRDDGTKTGALRRVRILGATPITLIGEPADTPVADPTLVQIG
jgi:tRNA-2-methylthio-N6-dimethylallyladenosine synthase